LYHCLVQTTENPQGLLRKQQQTKMKPSPASTPIPNAITLTDDPILRAFHSQGRQAPYRTASDRHQFLILILTNAIQLMDELIDDDGPFPDS
jgi:hypothetical protein